MRSCKTGEPAALAVFIAVAAAEAGCSDAKQSCASPDTVCMETQRPWSNPLPIPPAFEPGQDPDYPGADYYELHATQFQQWFGLYAPESSERLYTTVWGYGQLGHTYDVGVRTADGATIPQTGMYIAPAFLTERGKPGVVKWIDDRKNTDGSPLTAHLLESAYDTTIAG